MLSLLVRVALTGVALYAIVTNVPGIAITGGWMTIGLIALIWAVIVAAIKPVLKVLTFPITLLTLGIFSFVLNAALFWGMTLIVPSFIVSGIIPALVGSIVMSLASWAISKVF
ncbi:MAG: phage holin family protein [Patescibacteria group bacterium]